MSHDSNEASARIFAFYLHDQPDNRGRRLADILARGDDWLERTQGYVQWLFPLPEPSGSNPHAPWLDSETIAAFRANEVMRDRLRSAYLRMLRFYGLRERTWHVEKGENWDDRKTKWATAPTHNNLRITRILRSMCLLGLRTDAEAFKGCLMRLAQLDADCDFDEQALACWCGATAEV
ncbi:opioid growth factor receptor-related protein [Rudaea sp.]|uniref:opioid growth factor receptor-related protein n=1 Tax=Rudaea sp. TaxID=2136325 RepID=UPI002ED5EF9E